MFIRTKNLTVTYLDEKRPILRNVSLQIGSDERVLLLGPSGAGKSTLLYAFAGLVPRAIEARLSGSVYLDGRPVTEWTPAQVAMRLGYVFQEPDSQFCMLYPEDEIAFGLENLGWDPVFMRTAVTRSFERVGLSKAIQETRIDRLSGGQQQRLALACILAQEPKMLLLDEPTALLDPRGRRLVVDTVFSLADDGKGIIVVEHLLDPWLELLERVVVLDRRGELVADDTPQVVFARHRSALEELGVWLPQGVSSAGQPSAEGAEPGSSRGPREYGTSVTPNVGERAGADQPAPRSTPQLTGHSASHAPHSTSRFTPHSRPHHAPASTPRSAQPKTTSALSVVEVRAGYREGQTVLHHVSLEVGRGEFWALIGPNGSGKSTLAKTLIRMLQPSVGEVRLQGIPVNKLRTRELTRHIAYVFQNPEHQFVTDTVWGEINYSLKQAGVPESERADRIHAALAHFGLEEHMASNPFALSGGQKRRLAVAAMLQSKAPLLVLDEPTFGQDRHHAHQLMQTIAALHADGVAVLMLTHDMDLVDLYAEKVAVLCEGRLVFSGPVADLWARADDVAGWGLELPLRLSVSGCGGKGLSRRTSEGLSRPGNEELSQPGMEEASRCGMEEVTERVE